MSTENEGELSSQQRARISQNFRAAKARLARKRPRPFSPVYRDGNGTTTLTSKTSIERVPLAEICCNSPLPFSVEGSKLTDEKSKSALYTDGKFGISDQSVKAKEVARNIDNAFALESYTTPVKELGSSGLTEVTAPHSVVINDDDFDDSVLKEIDALCELHSVKRAYREDQVQFPDNGSATYKSNLDPVNVEGNVKIEGTCETSIDTQWSAKLSCLLKEVEKKSMPEDYLKYLNSLNDRQQEAACCNIAIPLMIVAGPGSGKTSTMVGRVLMLLNEGIEPSYILAMTFTTAAASEMRGRIGSIAGKAIAKELPISTFHSFSLHLCRSHAEKLGRTPEFLIYGHSQQRRAVIEALRLLENDRTLHDNELGKLSDPRLFKDKSKKWLKFVTQAKASGKNPEECHQMGDQLGAMVLRNYNEILRSCNALDYHDLISCSVKLLTDFAEVIKESQESWKAIVIDEFQDTSAMQYNLLKILGSHNCITIVGDDDQSIFSFNGADVSGFDSFRKDFPNHKEVRLSKNYRSTRCIVEAASCLIGHNTKRCQLKSVLTDNSSGEKITFKECHNENAQCSFVVDKILEITSVSSAEKCGYGNIAILYRRQVSGKGFQTVFRDRKIPFNTHGVAVYRKKVVKAIIAMLKTTVPGCDDGPYRQVFKALLPLEKEEKKRMVDHIDKVSTVRKCSFLSAACDIFSAKISGTFKRSQLTQGRKVLLTLEMVSKLAHREQSISAVITSVANMIPQKYLLEQRAVVDVDGGKLLNEDNDIRSVLQYILDDISDFLSTKFIASHKEAGCVNVLKAFVDYINERENENFRSRRVENKDSVTLTTIHQSKGLEWDTVFIVKVNESEIPLMHDYNGDARENGMSLEEERRLFYVGMTRARKKLFILYVTVDSNWQLLQPSRFLKEIPDHLRETQVDLSKKDLPIKNQGHNKDASHPQSTLARPCGDQSSKVEELSDDPLNIQTEKISMESMEEIQEWNCNNFIRRFNVEDRAVVSHLFHQWAKKKAFQDPKRLLDKVGFMIDERLTVKNSKHKDVLHALKTCLRCEEAIQYAEYVLRWEQIPADKRAHLMREKKDHFQKLRIENAMSSSEPTAKQIAFLQSLGCTIVPTSRLHASNLIEQYKSL